MGLLKLLTKPLSGYPGGYKKMRRGSQPVDAAPPFQRPDTYDDRRSRIPPTGYREYWYPALPAKDIKRGKPEALRMLGSDLVFFRDQTGQVQALLDWCPPAPSISRWAAATSPASSPAPITALPSTAAATASPF